LSNADKTSKLQLKVRASMETKFKMRKRLIHPKMLPKTIPLQKKRKSLKMRRQSKRLMHQKILRRKKQRKQIKHLKNRKNNKQRPNIKKKRLRKR